MLLSEFMGGSREAILSGGDYTIFPWVARCWRVVPDTVGRKIKVPDISIRAWRTGTELLVVWNDSGIATEIAQFDGTKIKDLPANGLAMVSMIAGKFNAHVS
jgi:hypothetical protein